MLARLTVRLTAACARLAELVASCVVRAVSALRLRRVASRVTDKRICASVIVVKVVNWKQAITTCQTDRQARRATARLSFACIRLHSLVFLALTSRARLSPPSSHNERAVYLCVHYCN